MPILILLSSALAKHTLKSIYIFNLVKPFDVELYIFYASELVFSNSKYLKAIMGGIFNSA